ncbi:MAG: class I SAM-dependent methyltransferase [Bacteroidales bacterium]
MQYEPFKDLAGRLIGKSILLRKLMYLILDLLFLRAWHLRKTMRKLQKTIPPDASVLDAGSGLGQHTWWMAKHFKNWKITGVDIISEQINDCIDFFRQVGLGERVTFNITDLVTYSQENKYNFIVSVDVMEHIENDVQVFRNFYNSLKPGGILLVTTPSDTGGPGACSSHHSSFIDEHVRNGYSRDEITMKLNSAGFTSTEIAYTYGKPGYLSWLLSIKYPALMINRSIVFIFLLPLYYIIVLPFAFILNIADVNIKHKCGTGLLITAIKQ